MYLGVFGLYILEKQTFILCCGPPAPARPNTKTLKVLTYVLVEQRAVSGVFQNIDPHPLSTQRVCPPPATKAGGTQSPGGEGVGGLIFWKTPDIGLASYSIQQSIYAKTPRVSCSLVNLSEAGVD
jgi:hypothetical protein